MWMIFMEEASGLMLEQKINNVLEEYLLQTAALAKYLPHIKCYSSLQGWDMQYTQRGNREISLPAKVLNNTNKTHITPANSLPEGGQSSHVVSGG